MIKKEVGEIKGVIRRVRRKDFSGNTGQAIKNSGYKLATLITAKVGSMLFTIIIARMLMPELFGLYGLALSTILFLGIFSDLGISSAMLTFISKTIDKKKRNAKAYFYYLSKIKLLLILLSSMIILLTASWLANIYYQQPIFYALLAGAIYLPLTMLSRFFEVLFVSRNNFRRGFFGELIFQTSRLIILPLLILFLISRSQNNAILLFWIFIGLSICFFMLGVYYTTSFLFNNPFSNIKKRQLNKKEKKELWRFILPLTVTALSGIFFSHIDIIMLGHYVSSEFIGFYQAAFNLIVSAAVILSFSSIALFPIFSRMKGKQLERGFKRTRNLTFLISLIVLVFTILISKILIKFVYGMEYLDSVIYLQYFSLLLISFPLIKLYSSYYMAQKRTARLSVLLIISTILNIILNYILINIGLSWGMNGAVLGACTATIISRFSYLAGLMIFKKKI